MPLNHEQLLTSLATLSREQIQQAGQRYTPGVDPQAPNLRIASMFTAIENLACGLAAQTRFQAVLNEFSEAWTKAKYHSQRQEAIQEIAREARASLISMMPRLRMRDTQAANEWIEHLSSLEKNLQSDIAYWRTKEEDLPVDSDKSYDSTENNKIRANINSLGRCLSIVHQEKEYAETAAFKVLYKPQLLVSGEWGTGKTHLLCDVTQDRIGRGKATALVLAKSFHGRILEEICDRIENGLGLERLFDNLQEIVGTLEERTIVIIDGVNEGSRREWRQAISTLMTAVANRPGIGLIITCRTPFEPIAIEKNVLNLLLRVKHRGFEDQEFDAQASFFQYYNLPLPEVPLLDIEFSRPLTLKLICQSLQNLTKTKLAKGFSGIASGQRGMTYILESFIKRIGKPIEDEYGLNPKGCWLLLKGDDQVADRRLSGFAPCMAETLRDHVRPTEADRIIAAKYPAFPAAKRKRLLEAFRTNGLIEEDVIWYSTKSGVKSRIAFRLPYQRFSDHIIARHLLKAHLDVSSARTIKQSLLPKSPLGRIFKIGNRNQNRFSEPGWAQALITEFPERVGNKLAAKDRELFFSLPPRSRNFSAYFEPFIEGIFWRNPETFTEGTRLLINQYLNTSRQGWERVVDALAAVATKPKHPYHAKRLYDFLAQRPMANRDLTWSEYLRRQYASPTIHRLLTWANKLDAARMTEKSAKELVILLSLVLTTVVRHDRDVATKALVLIGEKFPEILFAHAVESLRFNDPYVSERVLAAAYGVTLSLVDSEESTNFTRILGGFAETIYRRMFGPGARYATRHTLKLDYALGIIQISQRANCVKLPKTATENLSPPYPRIPSMLAGDGTPDPAVTEAIDHAIHMDFGNYTIGRLIPNRANYDDRNPTYVRVRAQIERRMFDLGYRKELFENADQQIGRLSSQSDEQKVDRYGKKYSWIAYFEMWGEREANKALPDWRLGERTSDCGIDPSLPKRPPTWIPPIPDLIGDLSIGTEAWVESNFKPNWKPLLVVPEINEHQGEWVLLDGFVRGINNEYDRELFAFLRGVFVSRKDVNTLRSKFRAVEYPGNSTIPGGAGEHYLFAGEAGRRSNYARHLLQKNGRYRRQVEEVFDRYVPIKSRKYSSRAPEEAHTNSRQQEDARESLFKLLGPIQKRRHIPGIKIEIPSINFGWESYHSKCNDFSGFDLPAPSLIQRLKLASKNREVDFYDSTGRPGTFYREAGGEWKGRRHKLLYIRADLLRQYLKETRQVLVWCNWGERDWLKKMDGYKLIDNPARSRIYQAYRHIHRSFSEWSG